MITPGRDCAFLFQPRIFFSCLANVLICLCTQRFLSLIKCKYSLLVFSMNMSVHGWWSPFVQYGFSCISRERKTCANAWATWKGCWEDCMTSLHPFPLISFSIFFPVLCYLSLSSLSYLQSLFSQSSSVPAAPLNPFMQKGRDGAKGGSEGEKPLKGGRAVILCRCGKKVGDLGAWSRRGPSVWAVGSSGGA